MIKWLQDRRTIAAERRSIEKINRSFKAIIEAAPPGERPMLDYQRHFESELHQDLIEQIKTRRAIQRADRFEVPVPAASEDSPDWDRSTQLGVMLLTTAGHASIRSAIRQERKERREALLTWASMLIGLIGSLTGIVSVWLAYNGPTP